MPHHTRPCRRRRAGFTLVELVTVLVLLGILSAVAAARIATMDEMRARVAVNVLQRDLAFVRERAINTGLTHWVAINTGTHTYTVELEPTPGAGFAARTALTDPATGRAFSVAFNTGDFAGVTFTSTNLQSNPIGFNRLGRPVNTSGTVVNGDSTATLTGGRTLTITGSTGAILRSGNP